MDPAIRRPSIPSTATDLALLRRYEPIVRYTQGEQFFPTDVQSYMRQCSLWVHHANGRDELIVPAGELDLERLTEPRAFEFGAVEYLRFVPLFSLQEAARAMADVRQLRLSQRRHFVAGQGRLARGGLLPRLADALFSVTLLLRGRVPGAVAAAAELSYHKLLAQDERYVYHGRVVRQNGWTILQYWFFFAYNSWRSGFSGVNDHESDWEMILVYLYQEDGSLYPEWAGYASHDFHGDDLRRRWDDQRELEVSDGHPVVYAGAGSHASYFRPGEYQAEVSLPLPKPVGQALGAWNRFWTQTLGQASSGSANPFRIPFVDYARGDGLSIGPHQPKAWTPVVIDEDTSWVCGYRGLWGLFARDPISGENAPAGPLYNRDGSPRGSWYDPLGFAGLDQVPPPPRELPLIEERIADLLEREAELATDIPLRGAELEALGVELASLRGSPHLVKQHEALGRKIAEQAAALKSLRREQSENVRRLESLRQRAAQVRAGIKDDPQAHIRHLGRPVSPARIRFNRLAEFWAAVSISVLLLGIVALAYGAPSLLWLGTLVLIGSFLILESLLRGTFLATINNIAVLLAIIATVILVGNFWQPLMTGLLVLVAVFLLLQKLRELKG